MIKQAFILAAGLGLRMRPITNDIPKPMIEVHGQSIITRILDELIQYGIKKIIINASYRAAQLIEHVKNYIKDKEIHVLFSQEDEPLETGGGIIKALPMLEKEPFFAINSDSLFLYQENLFSFLSNSWNQNMNALLLLCEKANARGYEGSGDFDLDSNGCLIKGKKPYIYTGIQITKPQLFEGLHIEKTSWMPIYDKLKFEKIYGVKFPGKWLHIGTPEMVEIAGQELANPFGNNFY